MLRELRALDRNTFLVLVSGDFTVKEVTSAMRDRLADDVAVKPFRAAQLVRRVERGEPCAAEGEVDRPTLDAIVREHIIGVLLACENNVTLAAERLGMHRTTLQRKLADPALRASIAELVRFRGSASQAIEPDLVGDMRRADARSRR